MIQHCARCLMPSTRPRMHIDEDGVCSACRWHDEQKLVDWDARQKEFERLVDSKRKHQTYDCIIPYSGGKDSSAIAWKCKNVYGLNPLLVTYGQMIWTDVGRRNWHKVRDAGFDILYWGVNQDVSRKLARRFLIERFHIKNHYDAAVAAVPIRTAIQMGIPLVLWAEFGEGMYGGHVLSEEHNRKRDAAEILENLVGDDARNWAIDGVTEKDLFPYIYPDEAETTAAGVEGHYWSYYHPWDVWSNAMLVEREMGFEGVEPRSDGSHEGRDSIDDAVDGIDFWAMGQKFGFARSTRICSRLIQMGHMTRDEGLRLVRQYDHEFPEMYLDEVLDYVSMTRQELMNLADLHRAPEIWKQDGDSWSLRCPPE